MTRPDQLEVILEPALANEVRVGDYQVFGEEIVDLAFRSRQIRERHGLDVAEIDGARTVEWERDGTAFKLVDRNNGTYFLIATLRLAGDNVVKDIFCFGDERIAKNGLTYVLHRAAKEKSSQGYFNLSKLGRRWRKDGTNPSRHLPPSRFDRGVFRHTLLTIGESVS